MVELTGILKQLEAHTYTLDKCFLCGCNLTDENQTEEHVIPKWVQRRFNLWNQQITLLNGSLFYYRSLTIPCCRQCNNNHLKPFEDKVLKAFNGGFDEFKNLDKSILFLWLSKIYFGVIYKELFLIYDRKNIENGTITTPHYLDSFFNHYLFLQGIRGKHSFDGFFPASIFIFKTQTPENIENQWDFIDSQNPLFLSIRMGEVGVIAALQDLEVTKGIEEGLEHHRDIELYPLQFRELTAKILYKVMLINRIPNFLSSQTKDKVITYSLNDFNYDSIFAEWDNDIFAKILSNITTIPLDECQPEKGKVWTWLTDQNGKSIFIDANEWV